MAKTLAIDLLKPLPSLWYENEGGDKYILSDEELMNADIPDDKEYHYQHSVFPLLVDSVCVKNKPQLSEGHTTINCIEPIVLYLVSNKGWSLPDAITAAASTCERCLNILLEETTGEPYLERDTANTYCEQCDIIDPAYASSYKDKENINECFVSSLFVLIS